MSSNGPFGIDIDAVKAANRQTRAAGTRSEGYQNYPQAADPKPFPDTQVFNHAPNVVLASGTTATSSSTAAVYSKIALDAYIPANANFAHCYFEHTSGGSGTVDLTAFVRRDEQADSTPIQISRLKAGVGFSGAQSIQFSVPITGAGQRSFEISIHGTGTSVSACTWTLQLRGYTTVKKSASDANAADGSAGGDSGPTTDGGSGHG